MDKISKLIFTQAVMITTAILFGQGIIYAIIFLTGGQSSFEWEWYIPLSIVLAGILCALPTVLLDFPEKNDNGKIGRKYIHFICVGLIVTICGYVFGWYSTPTQFLIILTTYVLIYAFAWAASIWIMKTDDRKINEALDDIRDDE